MKSSFRGPAPGLRAAAGIRPPPKPKPKSPAPTPKVVPTMAPDAAVALLLRVLSGQLAEVPRAVLPSLQKAIGRLHRRGALMPAIEQAIERVEDVDPKQASLVRYGLAAGRWAILLPV